MQLNNIHKLTGIILAAGSSTRFGGLKQCGEIDNGTTLLAHVITQALNSNLAEVVVVLGYENARILMDLGALPDHKKLTVVQNADYESGLSTSLKAGLKAVQDRSGGVMFILGDQPRVTTELINRLTNEYRKSNADLCVPMVKTATGPRRPGNPVIIGRKLYPEVFKITGDIGARDLVKKYLSSAKLVELDDDWSQFQINTREDLREYIGDKSQ